MRQKYLLLNVQLPKSSRRWKLSDQLFVKLSWNVNMLSLKKDESMLDWDKQISSQKYLGIFN